MKDMCCKNLRTMVITTSTATDVRDTSMLKGEAKDSLTGSNKTEQYYASGDASPGPYGGKPSGK